MFLQRKMVQQVVAGRLPPLLQEGALPRGVVLRGTGPSPELPRRGCAEQACTVVFPLVFPCRRTDWAGREVHTGVGQVSSVALFPLQPIPE